MKILLRKDYGELLNFLPHVKSSLKEWLFVDVRLVDSASPDFPIERIAELAAALFKQKEGRLYVCNDKELLMLIRSGVEHRPTEIAKDIEKHLPPGTCEVKTHESTIEGLTNLALRIAPSKVTRAKPAPVPPFIGIRNLRKENVILIADNDLNERRRMIDCISSLEAIVYEVRQGNEVLETYKKAAPDVFLLDLDMPDRRSMKTLEEVLAIDPAAYVIATGTDISPQTISALAKKGIKGFVAKPYSKNKLQSYIQRCPTISSGTYRG